MNRAPCASHCGAQVQSEVCNSKEKNKGHHVGVLYFLEVQAGFEPADNGVADRGLTTWLLYRIYDCLNIITELLFFVKWFLVFFYLFYNYSVIILILLL